MPTMCSIYIHVPRALDGDILIALRERLFAETGLSAFDFYPNGPLAREQYEWAMPEKGGAWYNANLLAAFYWPNYPRGDLPTILRVAEWLEQNVPSADVWYGNDCTDESIGPFGAKEREILLQHWRSSSPAPENSS